MDFYVARDENEDLYLYKCSTEEEIPTKDDSSWLCDGGDYWELDNEMFPNVKWEDETPTKVDFTVV